MLNCRFFRIHFSVNDIAPFVFLQGAFLWLFAIELVGTVWYNDSA